MCVYGEVQCKHLTFDLQKKKPQKQKEAKYLHRMTRGQG